MLYPPLIALAAALLLFGWIGLRARRPAAGLDDYLLARDSQGASALGLSFLASGMGAWILFAPPEIAAFVGPVALGGYALGAALPFIVFAACGPAIRRHLPRGRSIGEFAEACYGGGVRRWVALISALYMLCFLAAELTAVGAIVTLLSDLPAAAAVLAVAFTTLVYTAWGGLRASLVTDRWQGLLLIVLLALVGMASLQLLKDLPAAPVMPSAPVGDALAVAFTLVIAVTAANLFHQGYWQRLWAARDGGALGRGAVLGGVTTVLAVAAVGGIGMLAAMAGLKLGQPPLPFFAALGGAAPWLVVAVLVLAVTLVASSVDTLQNAIASLAVTEARGLTVGGARWITLLVMIPVVLIALQGISVLRLFLIADLLCATAVVPVLMGLWRRMRPAAAVAGGLAGLLGAVLPGWVAGGSLWAGLQAASFPGGIPTLAPFAGALIASTLVAVLVALLAPRQVSSQV
ncbi:sodium:solute symporter family transporter [Alkalilimnicola sp. S0819]|uniref:sodium:solute symporter family transporter n=1 Tax=Alkalilimnicola sp. S0819 TaxID=2613922 RepID=UPI0012628E25|nr:sodium:solute symporter [Alkalilimnicola sp. S0819]KAB7622687.1 sodium:solute symporter [Alkalilimnicola sp. S0819]MPQ17325.1 sodium:solute symporter [Alkalilimnicola sp. S0819]